MLEFPEKCNNNGDYVVISCA